MDLESLVCQLLVDLHPAAKPSHTASHHVSFILYQQKHVYGNLQAATLLCENHVAKQQKNRPMSRFSGKLVLSVGYRRKLMNNIMTKPPPL